MARTTNNVLTKNYSGKVAGQYSLRTRGKKSIIAGLPKPREGAPSTVQVDLQKAFKLAVMYARKAMNNPDLKVAYAAVRRDNQSAYNVAFADAYKGPELSDLRTESYTGAKGDQILVQAIDNFRVTTVKFILLSADGNVLETGDAIEDENGYDWVFTCKVENPSLPGTIIRITAEDIPKNKAVLEARL